MQNLLISLAMFSLVGGGIAALYVFLTLSWLFGIAYAISALASFAVFMALAKLLDQHTNTQARLDRLEQQLSEATEPNVDPKSYRGLASNVKPIKWND